MQESEQPQVTDVMLLRRLSDLFDVQFKIVGDFKTDEQTLRTLVSDIVEVGGGIRKDQCEDGCKIKRWVKEAQDSLTNDYTAEGNEMGSGGTEVPFNGGRPQDSKPFEKASVLESSREMVALSDQVLDAIERLREIKAEHPSLRVKHPRSAGPILNAYREGDVSFDEAVRILNELICEGDQMQVVEEKLVVPDDHPLRDALTGNNGVAHMLSQLTDNVGLMVETLNKFIEEDSIATAISHGLEQFDTTLDRNLSQIVDRVQQMADSVSES